nr:ribosomal protein S6 [Proteomonas sp. NEIS-1375]
MARLGKLPVLVPAKVNIDLQEDNIKVKGPKGELSLELSELVTVTQEEEKISVQPSDSSKKAQQFHGLYRTLILNMVEGVTSGFEKKLELQGVGYRAQLQGRDLILNVGYSHQITIPAPAGITMGVENNTLVTVSGPDKQLVGQIASNIKSVRPPEPYKGKGIRYQGEYVRRKVGKAGK